MQVTEINSNQRERTESFITRTLGVLLSSTAGLQDENGNPEYLGLSPDLLSASLSTDSDLSFPQIFIVGCGCLAAPGFTVWFIHFKQLTCFSWLDSKNLWRESDWPSSGQVSLLRPFKWWQRWNQVVMASGSLHYGVGAGLREVRTTVSWKTR